MADEDLLSEEDIKHLCITPAIERTWQPAWIRMEKKITDGRVNIKGNVAAREHPKKADYVLYHDGVTPLAIVEAKSRQHSISYGIQQAKEYAQMMDIRFAYSSNGDGFCEYDFLTGKECLLDLKDFPSPEELWNRFIKEGKLNACKKQLMEQPYYTFPKKTPRYYQQVAVDRVLMAIAKGQQRLLLVMATGTGKTYTAFQIVYRLYQQGIKKKVLYLADRNILVDQSLQQDFAPLAKVAHKVNFQRDKQETISAYEIYFALYQQMVGQNGEEHFRKYFQPGFFDLIIVDECHRGSAKEESRWRRILEYFSSATQIGMTATPKETKYVSNINYFGKPVYTYSLKQGIEDGFLAPFHVINVQTNIGDGWRPKKGQKDANGQEIPDRVYNNSDYDKNIIITDRTREVAEQITAYLKATDRMAKTIVFCETEEAAERMRQALVQCNEDMMQQNPDYIVRITGSDAYGKDKLNYFISVTAKYPVIATTSDLLSTGVDCKMVKLIVIDKNINSMTQFKQIIGRGTRLRTEDGKWSFTVMDFRGVTRLFADPDWDGPIEEDEDYGTEVHERKSSYRPKNPPKQLPVVRRDGCRVFVTMKLVSVYDAQGKLLHQENIQDYTRENVQGTYGDLQTFIRTWSAEAKKKVIAETLKQQGIDLSALKKSMNMEDVDDFDFICHVAYDQKPLTRRERAEGVKKRDFLRQYSGAAREVLETLLTKYMNLGIQDVEETSILKLDDFKKFGTPSKIARLFGGKKGYLQAVKQLEHEIYKMG